MKWIKNASEITANGYAGPKHLNIMFSKINNREPFIR